MNHTDRLIEQLRLLAAESPRPLVRSPDKAHVILWKTIAAKGFDLEHFAVLGLTKRNRQLGCEILTTGNDQFTVVDPRQIYSWALRRGRCGAAAVIVAHCHPSGDPEPSEQDIKVTLRVSQAGGVLGIPLLDHLILTESGKYRSLREEGHLGRTTPSWPSNNVGERHEPSRVG